MGRAAAVSSLVAVILFAAAPGSASARDAVGAAANRPAATALATRPLFAAPPAPTASIAAVSLETFSGFALGTVLDTGTVTNGSDGLSLNTNSLIDGQLTFTFSIEPDGTIKGEGHGEYTNADYSTVGSWEKGPIGCQVPVTGSPFKVEVSGRVHVSASQRLGEIALSELNLKLNEAVETSPEQPCGSGFTIYASTSTILADSLAASQEPFLMFNADGLVTTVSKTVPYNNGNGTVGTDDGTWSFGIQPTFSVKRLFAPPLESLAVDASADGGGLGAIVELCLTLVPPPFDVQCVNFYTYYAAATDAQAQFYKQIADDPVDRHYTSVAKPLTGPTPRIRSVRGLNAKQAAALNALLKAQARAVGLASAVATAVNRYSGAALGDNTHWEQKQHAAARTYAGQLASSLATELTAAKHAQRALTNTVLHSLKVTATEIRAFQESVASHGIPHSLAVELANLKISPADSAAIRVELERANPAIIATQASLLTAIDFPVKERDTRAAIHALRSLARTGE
jgi:hypothetical protein